MTARQLNSIRKHLAAVCAVLDEIRTDRIADKAVAGRRLGDRIRNVCRLAGINQAQLADRVGMAPAQLCRIVTGRTDPSIGTLRQIADALGVSAASLVS